MNLPHSEDQNNDNCSHFSFSVEQPLMSSLLFVSNLTNYYLSIIKLTLVNKNLS